jgi:hypothetical protein
MMMKVVIVLTALLALTYASTDCDDLTIIKVKSQWARAYGHGHQREHFIEAVWRTFFNLAPEARDKLKQVGSEDTSSGKFRAFSLISAANLDMAVTFLDNEDALNATLTHLHKIHDDKHVAGGLIDTFIKALGHVVPAQLGRCWDKEAWKACFKIITDGIKGEHH